MRGLRRARAARDARSGRARRALLTLALLASVALPVLSGLPPGTSGPAAAQSPNAVAAYWLVASDGGVFAFGGAGFYGSTGAMVLNKPVVGLAGTPDSKGYWLVASDGGVFAYGDAQFYGSTGAMVLNKPVVGLASTPDGKGYWLVASDGGVFAFGDAQYWGSTGNMVLNKPVVGMARTADGRGYWLVASDGGIFAFGDARFWGSTGNLVLNQPVVGMAPLPNGNGYDMVAADGGIFAFGNAPFFGSLGGLPLKRPIAAMAGTPDGQGYWFTDTNGAISAFGDATYWGSAPQVLTKPVVGMAEAAGTGTFSSSSYPSGSYGYDVSNYQCGAPLPQGNHVIGIVEVEGYSMGPLNSCFSTETAWAGAGLNLYLFLTYNQQAAGPAACTEPTWTTAEDQVCNYGFAAAENAYTLAANAGANANVGWWLDVESYVSSPSLPGWNPDLVANAALVQGALYGLKAEGINSAGIYASPGAWNTIVGNYQPAVPYWMAWWSGNGGPYNCANTGQFSTDELPTGGVVITQYSSTATDATGGGPFDADYAC